MKLKYGIAAVSLLILILLSVVCEGMRCIRCESVNNEESCEEDMSQENVDLWTRECDDPNQDICMKNKVQAMRTSWTAKNGRLEIATTKISRFCGKTSDYPWTGCWFRTGKAGQSWTCACGAENCNSTGRAGVSILMIVTGLALARMVLS